MVVRRQMVSKAVFHRQRAGLAQWLYLLAAVWTIQGSSPVGGDGEFSLTRILCYDKRVSSQGIKRQERGLNHPSPSSAEVKGRVELYLYSPLGLRVLL